MCLRAIWSDEDEEDDDDDDGGGEVRARLDQCERSLGAAFPPRDGCPGSEEARLSQSTLRCVSCQCVIRLTALVSGWTAGRQRPATEDTTADAVEELLLGGERRLIISSLAITLNTYLSCAVVDFTRTEMSKTSRAGRRRPL